MRIYTNQCEYEPVLARYPFIFDADENCCQTLENTDILFKSLGKDIVVSMSSSSSPRFQLWKCIDITGGPVLDEYQFLQFHMHWGSNDNEGSEHVIDGFVSRLK